MVLWLQVFVTLGPAISVGIAGCVGGGDLFGPHVLMGAHPGSYPPMAGEGFD